MEYYPKNVYFYDNSIDTFVKTYKWTNHKNINLKNLYSCELCELIDDKFINNYIIFFNM